MKFGNIERCCQMDEEVQIHRDADECFLVLFCIKNGLEVVVEAEGETLEQALLALDKELEGETPESVRAKEAIAW